MKSSIRIWGVAAAILALSLSLKIFAVISLARAAQPVPRIETLRRFLVAATDAPVERVTDKDGPGGWRFQAGACRDLAFPSGVRGSLDLDARRHARRRDEVVYVYRGKLSAEPPSSALAMDFILHRLTTVFRPANEPGYVVLIYPKSCGPPRGLPWARLPID